MNRSGLEAKVEVVHANFVEADLRLGRIEFKHHGITDAVVRVGFRRTVLGTDDAPASPRYEEPLTITTSGPSLRRFCGDVLRELDERDEEFREAAGLAFGVDGRDTRQEGSGG